MKRPLYQVLASLVQARINCIESNNTEWRDNHEERIEALVKEHMPRGSGFDAGTTLDLDKSTGEKLVFKTSYHHMNDYGVYDGWTEHVVTVKPSLMYGVNLMISGRNRRDIKDYMYDVFYDALKEEVHQ